MPTLPPARLVDGGIDDVDARALIDWIRWWRPLKLRVQHGLGFRHPWDLSARWRREKNRWEIAIEPGYVNGQEVESPAVPDADDVPIETLYRPRRLADGRTVIPRPWLSESPWIPVPAERWRTVGAAGETVPPYFARLGVKTPEGLGTSTADEFGLSTNLGGTLEDRARARQLRAVDVVLEQPRPRVETVIEAGPTGQAQLVASIAAPVGFEAAPRVQLRREPDTPEPTVGSIQELLATGGVDEGRDRIRLGTIYLLSPPGAVGEPDATWQAVPVNREFWNLNHAVTRELGLVEPVRLNLGVPLAGGVAQGLIEASLSSLASDDAVAAAFLTRARIVGRFWTV